jgi:hypothetical protein
VGSTVAIGSSSAAEVSSAAGNLFNYVCYQTYTALGDCVTQTSPSIRCYAQDTCVETSPGVRQTFQCNNAGDEIIAQVA